jgi:hypothetical protein
MERADECDGHQSDEPINIRPSSMVLPASRRLFGVGEGTCTIS